MISTITSVTLLDGLKDLGNDSAWRRFDERYRAPLVSFSRQLGLGPYDAEDAAQKTILDFIQGYRSGKYDRDKGRLKNWLLGIARHKIADMHAARRHQPLYAGVGTGSQDIMALVRDPETVSALWDEQWRQAVIRECFRQARIHFSDRDVRIFELLTQKDSSADEVAAETNVSREVVYAVKHRILKYMRTIQTKVETVW